MKKVLLVFAILFLIFSSVRGQTNVYHPFPDSNAFWGDKGWNIFHSSYCYNTRYGIKGDTIINGKNYKKIYSLFDSTLTNPYSTYFAAIREQNKRVYTVIDTFPEQILYDFNLLLGDTITYHFSLMDYIIYTFSRVVTQIDSVLLLDGKYRKRWTFAPVYSNPPQYSTDDIVVEGIGSITWRGLFNPLINAKYTNGDQYQFECFKDNDTLLYLDNPVCNHCFCTLLTDIPNEVIYETLCISPNPFSQSTQITLPQSYHSIVLAVYDIQGKQVAQQHYADCDKIQLNRNQLSNGLYFLKLTLDDKRVETGKIVISD